VEKEMPNAGILFGVTEGKSAGDIMQTLIVALNL